MYRQHRLREIGLRRGVSRDKNGLRRGLAGLNRTWTFDPCTPCLKFCTPTFKILPNSLMAMVLQVKYMSDFISKCHNQCDFMDTLSSLFLMPIILKYLMPIILKS